MTPGARPDDAGIPTAPPAHVRPLHAGRAAVLPRPEDAQGFIPVLRRGDFRRLWAAQAASQLADKFLMFTLLVVTYTISHASTTQSLLMLAYTLPSVLLSAPAGVYADRHDKRALMIATNVVRGGLILLIPLSQALPYLHGRTWPLLLVTLLFSATGQVFAPAEAASIPFLVRTNQIMVATSLFMTTVIVTLVAGVPLATISLKLFGDQAPFFIAAALFLVAAVCVVRVRTSLRAGGATPERHIGRELREGIVILARAPALRIALAELTLSLVVVFSMFALGPAYMRTVLHRPEEDTYLVLIPATLGMVVVALVLARWAHRVRRAHAFVGGMLAGGVALVAIGLVPDALVATGTTWLLTPVAVLISTVFGCALGALLIPAFTVLQERTNEDSRGRIFGGIFTIINAAVAAPLLLAGGMADAFGVDRAIAGIGVALVAVGVGTRLLRWSSLAVLDEPPVELAGSR